MELRSVAGGCRRLLSCRRGDLTYNSLVLGMMLLNTIFHNLKDNCYVCESISTSFENFFGILILTTNRVEDFDQVIKSRIHVSLYYPPFVHKAALKV